MTNPDDKVAAGGPTKYVVDVTYNVKTHKLTVDGAYQHLHYDHPSKKFDTVQWNATGCQIQVEFIKAPSPFGWPQRSTTDGGSIDSGDVMRPGPYICDYSIVVKPTGTTLSITIDPQIEVDDTGAPPPKK